MGIRTLFTAVQNNQARRPPAESRADAAFDKNIQKHVVGGLIIEMISRVREAYDCFDESPPIVTNAQKHRAWMVQQKPGRRPQIHTRI